MVLPLLSGAKRTRRASNKKKNSAPPISPANPVFYKAGGFCLPPVGGGAVVERKQQTGAFSLTLRDVQLVGIYFRNVATTRRCITLATSGRFCRHVVTPIGCIVRLLWKIRQEYRASAVVIQRNTSNDKPRIRHLFGAHGDRLDQLQTTVKTSCWVPGSIDVVHSIHGRVRR
jgi:hypothetical protein